MYYQFVLCIIYTFLKFCYNLLHSWNYGLLKVHANWKLGHWHFKLHCIYPWPAMATTYTQDFCIFRDEIFPLISEFLPDLRSIQIHRDLRMHVCVCGGEGGSGVKTWQNSSQLDKDVNILFGWTWRFSWNQVLKGIKWPQNSPEFTREHLKRFKLWEPWVAPRPPAGNMMPLVHSSPWVAPDLLLETWCLWCTVRLEWPQTSCWKHDASGAQFALSGLQTPCCRHDASGAQFALSGLQTPCCRHDASGAQFALSGPRPPAADMMPLVHSSPRVAPRPPAGNMMPLVHSSPWVAPRPPAANMVPLVHSSPWVAPRPPAGNMMPLVHSSPWVAPDPLLETWCLWCTVRLEWPPDPLLQTWCLWCTVRLEWPPDPLLQTWCLWCTVRLEWPPDPLLQTWCLRCTVRLEWPPDPLLQTWCLWCTVRLEWPQTPCCKHGASGAQFALSGPRPPAANMMPPVQSGCGDLSLFFR